MKGNQFTVQLLDVFLNEEAYKEPLAFNTVFVVMEYLPLNL